MISWLSIKAINCKMKMHSARPQLCLIKENHIFAILLWQMILHTGCSHWGSHSTDNSVDTRDTALARCACVHPPLWSHCQCQMMGDTRDTVWERDEMRERCIKAKKAPGLLLADDTDTLMCSYVPHASYSGYKCEEIRLIVQNIVHHTGCPPIKLIHITQNAGDSQCSVWGANKVNPFFVWLNLMSL